MPKPFPIIQLRPKTETADNEFEAIKRYGGLSYDQVDRIRAEQNGLPDIDLNQFAALTSSLANITSTRRGSPPSV